MATDEKKAPGIWQVLASVLASFLGVQSNRNRERDFQHGKPSQYIVIGLVFVILFVLAIVAVVQLVLHFAAH